MAKLGNAYLSLLTCILSFVMIGVIVSFLPSTDKNEPPILTEDDYLSKNCIHNYGEWEITLEPTCTTTGAKKQLCSICNYENVKSISTVAHTYEIFREEKPTCFRRGTTIFKCANCTASYVEDFPPQHTYIIAEAVAPTCTEIGLTEGEYCSSCGDVVSPQIVLEALGHTEATIKGVAPTCSNDGLTEGKKCSVCDTILVEQDVVSALGHDIVNVEAGEATCTSVGYEAYEYCFRCDYTTYQEIAKLPHTSSNEWADSGSGVWVKKCTVCEKTLDATYSPTFFVGVSSLRVSMQMPSGLSETFLVASPSLKTYQMSLDETITLTLTATKTFTGYALLTIEEASKCEARIELVDAENGIYQLTILNVRGNAVIKITGTQP